jgi:hypothetical protein
VQMTRGMPIRTGQIHSLDLQGLDVRMEEHEAFVEYILATGAAWSAKRT